ncbi:SHOCT domain-containing protein [Dactylosporangium sp. NPDC048998]
MGVGRLDGKYPSTAGGEGTAEELSKLAELRQRSVISAAEFERGKGKILS